MLETNTTTYRKDFSSRSLVTGAKSGVCITVEVVDIPNAQHKAIIESLNKLCAEISDIVSENS